MTMLRWPLSAFTIVVACLVFGAVQAHSQRYDPDSLWNLQPPSDTLPRNVFVGTFYGRAYQPAQGLECLEGGNCLPFEGGFGSSMNVFVGADQQFTTFWNVTAALTMHTWDVMMTVRDGNARIRMPDGSIRNLIRELSMQARGTTFGLRVGPEYHRENWRLSLSPTFEFALSKPTWSQSARILEPSGTTYNGGSADTVVVSERAIPNAALVRYGITGLVCYDVNVSGAYTATPSVGFQLMPAAIRSGSDWSDVRWFAGVSIRRSADVIPDTVDRIRTTIRIDTVLATRQGDLPGTLLLSGPEVVTIDTVRTGLLRQIMVDSRRTDTLVTIDPNLAEKLARDRLLDEIKLRESKRPVTTITLGEKTIPLRPRRRQVISIGELTVNPVQSDSSTGKTKVSFTITEEGDTVDYNNREVARELAIRLTAERQDLTFMIMPSVFFDSGSAVLPPRYRQVARRSNYAGANENASQHDVNLDILNIMGQRLDSLKEKLVVRGYSDESSEGASCELARARALAVVNYLRSVWGVDTSRIVLDLGTGSCAPNPASFGGSARGRAENRRVEFLSDDNQYFMPVQRVSFITKPSWDMSKATVNIEDTEDPVAEWEISYTQSDRLLESRRGLGLFRPATLSLSDRTLDSLSKDPILVTFHLKTVSGNETDADLEIPVDKLEKVRKFDNLSLAMFAVRSTDLSSRDIELLRTFAARLSAGDRVAILGYSDDLGSITKNQQLSQKRAESVAEQLRALRPDCVITRVEGLASNRYPIGVDSYEYPELRFMSRTVQLVVEKN